MSSLGSPSTLFLAKKKAYEVERSLRFNSGDSANLTRTSSSTSTTFTYSAWIKRCKRTDYEYIFSMGSNRGFSFHKDNDTFYLFDGSNLNESTAKFRDPSAWYHIVVQINSGVATSYINNVLVHNAVGSGFTLTTGSNETRIGSYASGNFYYNGYMAEINLVDGSVVAPSSFAETDPITGQWNPKKYGGGYGTNGFYLNFSDNSGTTATTLGKDSSGNGNNFTPNNFAVSDSITDTPSKNFCTLNPLNKTNDTDLREGNLEFFQSSNDESATATFGITSGKWYWEVYKNSSQNPELGIETLVRVLSNSTDIHSNTKVCFRTNGGDQTNGAGSAISLTGSSSGQTGAGVIAIAVDFDNKKIWYSGLSGIFFNSGNPATGSNAAFDFSSVAVANGCIPYVFIGTGGNNSCNVNFGQDGTFAGHTTAGGYADENGHGNFKYSVPSGYLALCSANLPDPTIKLPNNHFNTITWSGNNTSGRTLTGVGFAPSWTWLKCRSDSASHQLYDTVRGANKILHSNKTDAEDSSDEYGYLSAFTSDGFTLTNGSNASYPAGSVNMTGRTYVGWNWNAGDTDGKTYAVTVVSDSGNKYRFDGYGTSAVTLDLAEGGTYIFDQSDSSNAGHPLRFYTAADKTGGEYTTGVTTAGTPGSTGAYTQIVVVASAPTLYYQCSVHAGMGGQANTNSTLGSSNFDGTIQTTVKANQSAGFSIVLYEGQGDSDITLGHGLNAVPNVVLVKERSGSRAWIMYHSSLGANKYLQLASSQVALTNNDLFGNTTPTSSVFTVSDYGTSDPGDDYVAYCFSEVAGYSKFGSYVGNNNADGTFVFLGFRPAWLMIKNIEASSTSWYILDNKRDPDNPAQQYLSADNADAEATYIFYDFLSNGFKLRNTGSAQNPSGQEVIYLAFAESPFKNARAR